MEPLPQLPRNLSEFAEADLRRAARLIIDVQDEIDWHFRIATLKGDQQLAITMPDSVEEREAMLHRINRFMALHETRAFTLTSELREPDAIYAVAITNHASCHCLSRITREPRPWSAANFGPIEWLPPEAIDPALSAMFPRYPHDIPEDVTPGDRREIEAWFGRKGMFPAVAIGRLLESTAHYQFQSFGGPFKN